VQTVCVLAYKMGRRRTPEFFTDAGPAEGWHHRLAGANRVPRRMPRPVRA